VSFSKWFDIPLKPKVNKKSLKISKSNQNPYVEEEQTTQWPKEKVQKDKQRSTKHTHKTKDRLTRSSITLITIHLHTIVMRSSAMCLANVIKATLRRPIS
jgi:hypothetical protein